jgi:hypothetical protein
MLHRGRFACTASVLMHFSSAFLGGVHVRTVWIGGQLRVSADVRPPGTHEGAR